MMMEQFRRMATFAKYPKTSRVSERKLIAAGFEYTGTAEQVTCSDCHLTIDGWKDSDIPLNEHHRKSPDCSRLAQLPPPSQSSNFSIQNSASNYASENLKIINESPQSSSMEFERINKSGMRNERFGMKSEIDRSDPDFQLLKHEKVRLDTYFDWPQSSKLNPANLAKDGFFFIGERDKVQCAFCRGVLFNWLEGDCPEAEHRKHFPNCHFVRGRNVGNVVLEWYEDVDQTIRNPSPSSCRVSDPDQTIRNPSSSSCRVSEPASVEVQIQTNPATEAKNDSTSQGHSSNVSVIDRALEGVQARAVLSMGYSKQVVQQAISNQITNQGTNFESAEELLECILSSELESPDPMLPVTPNISELPVAPNLVSSSDDDLSLEQITRINNEHDLPVEINTGNCQDDQSTLRLNEEQLQNLQATIGLSSVAESTTTGTLKQKNKKRKKKTKMVTGNQNVTEPAVENGKGSSKSKESKINQQNYRSGATEMSETNIASNEDLQLMEENKVLRDARTCKVCMDKEVNTVFLPCGHLVCCNECAANIHNCAICRTLIRGTVKVFLS